MVISLVIYTKVAIAASGTHCPIANNVISTLWQRRDGLGGPSAAISPIVYNIKVKITHNTENKPNLSKNFGSSIQPQICHEIPSPLFTF